MRMWSNSSVHVAQKEARHPEYSHSCNHAACGTQLTVRDGDVAVLPHWRSWCLGKRGLGCEVRADHLTQAGLNIYHQV